jgi:YfiH family protein
MIKEAMIAAAVLERAAGVRHGFFTRQGGVSEGLFASLNCGFGSGDDPRRVAVNRARAAECLGVAGESLVTVHQTHSAAVAVADAPWPPDKAPRADAIVTRREGLALGVLTADCAPVLLADSTVGVVGAAHAGWRGARDGIVEATVAAMLRLGARAERIVAGVGPCIRQASYEVGPEFHAAFLAEDAANAAFFRPAPRAGHFLFDLVGYVRRRLERRGIASVATLDIDTCADEGRFYSYRRAVKRGERDYGRALSAIALKG